MINENKAGSPKIVNKDTVTILIGIIKFIGVTNKLYPYNTKALITILLIKLNNFFNIFFTNKNYELILFSMTSYIFSFL